MTTPIEQNIQQLSEFIIQLTERIDSLEDAVRSHISEKRQASCFYAPMKPHYFVPHNFDVDKHPEVTFAMILKILMSTCDGEELQICKFPSLGKITVTESNHDLKFCIRIYRLCDRQSRLSWKEAAGGDSYMASEYDESSYLSDVGDSFVEIYPVLALDTVEKTARFAGWVNTIKVHMEDIYDHLGREDFTEFGLTPCHPKYASRPNCPYTDAEK